MTHLRSLSAFQLRILGSLLEALRKHLGGEYRLSGPRSPVVGQLVANLNGVDRKIDVLRDVYGISPKELSSEAVTLDISLDGKRYQARVLSLESMLRAKTANLASLDQSKRNDFKHVSLLILVVRHYLTGLLEAVESGTLDSRSAIDAMERVRKVLTSPEALKCGKNHGIQFENAWPRDLLLAAKDPPIRNFVKHRLPD